MAGYAKPKFNAMDSQELQDALDQLLEDCVQIKTQLDDAKSKAATEGEYADRAWFNSAQHALRIKGQQQQFIQRLLGERRRVERQTHNNSVERRFVEAAKRRLHDEVFQDLMTEANDG